MMIMKIGMKESHLQERNAGGRVMAWERLTRNITQDEIGLGINHALTREAQLHLPDGKYLGPDWEKVKDRLAQYEDGIEAIIAKRNECIRANAEEKRYRAKQAYDGNSRHIKLLTALDWCLSELGVEVE
jgi:hypothetical protein